MSVVSTSSQRDGGERWVYANFSFYLLYSNKLENKVWCFYFFHMPIDGGSKQHIYETGIVLIWLFMTFSNSYSKAIDPTQIVDAHNINIFERYFKKCNVYTILQQNNSCLKKMSD